MKQLIVFGLIFGISLCALASFLQDSSPEVTEVEQVAPTEESRPPEPVAETTVTEPNPALVDGRPVAVRVNGQPIFLDDYERQVAQFEQSLVAGGVDLNSEAGQRQRQQLRSQLLEGLIEQTIIEQEAASLGITISEDQIETKAQESAGTAADQEHFEQWLAANEMSYGDFKETLRAQLIAGQLFEKITADIPDSAEQIRLRHILVAEEDEARQLIEQLKNGADFATLAAEHSLDEESRMAGGALGWFPQGAGVVPIEVERMAFSLQPREVSGPIPTALGFHIIQVEERQAARPLKTELLQTLKERAFTEWLAEKKATDQIEIFVTP